MFSGREIISLFCPQGSKPLDTVGVSGSVKKEYDKPCKSQVVVLATQSSKVTVPKTIGKVPLVLPALVMQMWVPTTSPITVDINVHDSRGKKRLVLSSRFSAKHVHLQHAQIPFDVPRAQWLNVMVDVREVYEGAYATKGAFVGISSFSISGAVRLRRIFVMASESSLIPNAMQFPDQVACGTFCFHEGGSIEHTDPPQQKPPSSRFAFKAPVEGSAAVGKENRGAAATPSSRPTSTGRKAAFEFHNPQVFAAASKSPPTGRHTPPPLDGKAGLQPRAEFALPKHDILHQHRVADEEQAGPSPWKREESIELRSRPKTSDAATQASPAGSSVEVQAEASPPPQRADPVVLQPVGIVENYVEESMRRHASREPLRSYEFHHETVGNPENLLQGDKESPSLAPHTWSEPRDDDDDDDDGDWREKEVPPPPSSDDEPDGHAVLLSDVPDSLHCSTVHSDPEKGSSVLFSNSSIEELVRYPGQHATIAAYGPQVSTAFTESSAGAPRSAASRRPTSQGGLFRKSSKAIRPHPSVENPLQDSCASDNIIAVHVDPQFVMDSQYASFPSQASRYDVASSTDSGVQVRGPPLAGAADHHADEEGVSRFSFDPILRCYFDKMSNQYYTSLPCEDV